MLVKLFPTGAGLFSIILMLVAFGLYKYFKTKNEKRNKIISLVVSILSLTYLFFGCCAVFKVPYTGGFEPSSLGYAYFKNNVEESEVTAYLDKVESASELIEYLAPNYQINEQIEQFNDERQSYYYYKCSASTTNSEIYLEFCNTGNIDNTYLKFKNFYNSNENYISAYENIGVQELLINYQYNTIEEGDYAAVIFSIKYDGIKFLLPWAQSSGASIQALFFFDETYIAFTETAQTIDDLTLISKFS